MSKYIKILRYIFAGGIATAFNLVILFICVHYLKIWYLIGAIIAFCCAVVISYTLQKFFVFKNYSRKDMGRQFFNFFIFTLFILGVNTLLMYVFVDVIGLWYILAQIFASIITACANYIYFSKFIFAKID